MNLNEFKKLLGSDPREEEPESRLAKPSGAEYDAARAEARAFEEKLRTAINVPPPPGLSDELQAVSAQAKGRRWLGFAAGVVMAIGAAALIWNPSSRPDTLDEHVAWHYAHDGDHVLARARPDFDPALARDILAQFDFTVGADMQDQVRFVKVCPGFGGESAHLVVETDDGMISIILFPGDPAPDHMLEFDGMQAYMVSLDGGTAAIIGRPEQHVTAYSDMVRAALNQVS